MTLIPTLQQPVKTALRVSTLRKQARLEILPAKLVLLESTQGLGPPRAQIALQVSMTTIILLYKAPPRSVLTVLLGSTLHSLQAQSASCVRLAGSSPLQAATRRAIVRSAQLDKMIMTPTPVTRVSPAQLDDT